MSDSATPSAVTSMLQEATDETTQRLDGARTALEGVTEEIEALVGAVRRDNDGS